MTEANTPPDLDLVDEWDEVTSSRTVRERVYEAATTLTEPTNVADIADRADCTKEGARPHLEWLVELGVLEKVSDNPALFVRNEAYFEFRRITELLRRFESTTEIDDALETYRRRDEELTEYFGEPSPETVVLTAVGDGFDEAYDHLSEWRTVRRRIRELREAKLRFDTGPDTTPASSFP